MRAIVIAFALVAAASCDNHGTTPDWSRMIMQPRLEPFGASDQFADGAAMRPVPAGTVPRAWMPESAIREGRDAAGVLVVAIPVPVTREVLERGRVRFDIVCAACHGIAGDGNTAVAHAMQRRRPPSLHEPRIVALSPGALYRVVVAGYGLMPSYAAMLTVPDRWAIVAYVRTLELSRRADVRTLPPTVAAELTRSVP